MIDDTSARRSAERPPVYYGRYELLSELGRGTSGVVYKAFDPKLDRLVALKILRPELTSLEESGVGLKQRFHQEAVAAGRLTHPAIVAVHDVGEAEGRPFMIMEYIEGGTLADLLLGGQPLSLADAVEIVLQVCAALDYAHRHGVVHRDIKPRNILVGPGVTKVSDFGTARILGASHTQTGTMMGTPAYISPEMVRGQAADPRSDLFSLGVVLYETVTGVNPFNAADLAAVLYRIVNLDAPSVRQHKAELPAALDRVLRRALAKEPESRFATATDFAGALREASTGERRRAWSPRNIREVVRDLRRKRVLWRPVRFAVGMMVLVALGAVTLAALRGTPDAPRSTAPSPAVKREMEPAARPATRAAIVTPPAAPSPVAGTPQETSDVPRTAMPAPVERREPRPAARPVTTVTPPTARPATPAVAAPVARPAAPVLSTATARPVAATPQDTRCLSVNALPFAEVYVDDQPAGYTPMACLRVPIGDHRVRFQMDGQKSPERVLKISGRHTPDAPLRLSYDFNSGRFIEQ
jgi:eukaryotic-like serine/threonine-protein kinase